MLLSVEPFDDAVEGTLLDVWFIGGDHKTLRPPCSPHYYSETEQGDAELVSVRFLSNPSVKRQLYRVPFPSLRALELYRLPDALESHKRFVDVLISEHGFACESAEPLKVLAFDFETFPFGATGVDWRRDGIRSIAVWGFGEFDIECEDAVIQRFGAEWGVCWSVCKEHDAVWVAEQFVAFVRRYDPDVLAGYNSGGYDVKVLLSQSNLLRFRCGLGRDGSQPFIFDRHYERRGKERDVSIVRVRGRVHLDVLGEVMLDQTLYDLKGRGLNEVAAHFGFSPIDDVNHAEISEDRLEEVNLDDARCTFGLSQLYLANLCALCEYLSVPLNLMVERSPSHVPNWFYGQEFARLGIVSDGYNGERFAKVFQRSGKPYQGAFVKCYRTGLFRNVEHVDFVSFYPTIMLEYNLSPETVSLVEIKPYTGDYRFERHEGYMIVEVPDVPKTKGKPDLSKAVQFVCRIDTSVDSVTRTKLKWIREERAKVKAAYKKTKDERLQSRQYALKVIQNTLYGYHGTGYALYGNVLCAVLITAIARYHAEKKIEQMRNTAKHCVEWDTDGGYFVKHYQDVAFG